MSSYIQNYGFTKTLIHDNNHNINNEIEWQGDYDGNIANINLNINENGNQEFVSMKLSNQDIMKMLGIQPVNIPIEQRLMNDFLSSDKTKNYHRSYKPLKPVTLEGALIKRKSVKKRHRKKRKTHKIHNSHKLL